MPLFFCRDAPGEPSPVVFGHVDFVSRRSILPTKERYGGGMFPRRDISSKPSVAILRLQCKPQLTGPVRARSIPAMTSKGYPSRCPSPAACLSQIYRWRYAAAG